MNYRELCQHTILLACTNFQSAGIDCLFCNTKVNSINNFAAHIHRDHEFKLKAENSWSVQLSWQLMLLKLHLQIGDTLFPYVNYKIGVEGGSKTNCPFPFCLQALSQSGEHNVDERCHGKRCHCGKLHLFKGRTCQQKQKQRVFVSSLTYRPRLAENEDVESIVTFISKIDR
jgi:hypothetical protein